MRGLGVFGIILIIAGAVVIALRGISYTKNREEVRLGPVEVAAEEKGFITPLAGGAAIAVGIVLVVADRQKRHA